MKCSAALHLALVSVFICTNALGQATSKVDTIEYSDNLSAWVIGQVSRTTTNGIEVTRTTYDPTTALPTNEYSFGALQKTTTYNADGTISSVADGNGNVTHFLSYMRGIPQEVDFPATPDQPSGSKMTAVVDGLGQINSVIDTSGAETCYGYDAMGRVNLVQYPSETTPGQCGGSWNQTQISFLPNYPAAYGLPAGLWRQRITTGNLMTETLFDGLWRPVVKQTYDVTNVNATMSQVVMRYDINSNTTFQSYPQRSSNTAVTNTWADPTQAPNATGTTSVYDALNRITSATESAEAGLQVQTTTSYLSGFATQVTDPKHNITTTSYLTYDQPTTDWPVSVSAPQGVTQTVARDVFGSPTAITQSGAYNGATTSVTKALLYDSAHRLCRTYDPESGSTLTSYDNANNVQTTASGMTITETGCGYDQVPSQAVTTYTVDAMNRVQSIAAPTGTQSTIYHYDALGRVKSSISGSAIQSYSYNALGLLTNEGLWLPGAGYSWGLNYGYDSNGHLSNVNYPNGEVVSYAPDVFGRPTQAGSYASAAAYYPNGDVSNFTFGNGTVYVAEQNTRQLTGNFSYGNGSNIPLDEDLLYDANGNITNVNDLANGPRTKAFTYDGLNRLLTAQASGLSINESYAYDAQNNLRQRLTGGVTFNLNYDGNNRLNTLTTGAGTFATYTYDTLGNRSTVQSGSFTSTYLFDAKNQMTQDVGFDSYAYDASGRRTTKTPVSGSPTYSFYSQAGQLMYQLALGSSQATNYIYLGKKLIARNSFLQLGAPGAITFSANPNNGSYTVSWGAVAGATSYSLQEQFNGGAWTQLPPLSNTSDSFSGRDGGSYTYQVQACASGSCGSYTLSATLGVTPALPVITVPTNGLSGAYTVSWSNPVGATSYNVQESFDGGSWTTIASGTAATSVSRPGTTNGTYTYQVTAMNLYGNRGPATSATVTVISAPGSIGFSQNPSYGSYTVGWSAVTAATSYVLQESYAGGPWTTVYQGSAISTAFANKDGGSYVYQVQACINSVCGPSATSSTLGVTPKPPVLVVPSSPSGPNYTVSWNAPLSATSYVVQESLNGGCSTPPPGSPIVCQGPWITIANGTTATSIYRSQTKAGTYRYQVAAINAYGTGNWSTVATLNVVEVPSTPTNLTATLDGNGKLLLSWDAMPSATYYQLVEYGTNGSLGEYNYFPTDNTFSMPAPPKGSYKITVSACNAVGCSAPATVGGNNYGIGNTSGSTVRSSADRSGRALDAGATGSGCTSTTCTIVTGSSP